MHNLRIELAEFDVPRLLAHWAWCIPQHYTPLFLSLFGDWFLRDGEGQVYTFDLVAGELKKIADSEIEFTALLETEEYQREWLMSQLAVAVEQRGLRRARGQCYAFQTPPMLGGQLSPDNVVVWDLAAYQSGTSKVHQQLAGLPPGGQVEIKPK